MNYYSKRATHLQNICCGLIYDIKMIISEISSNREKKQVLI